jgi:SAM-dependent methyltransferase
MDISPRSIARANAEAAGERYVAGDIRSTGLPTGSVDIICYSGVLHHLFDRPTRHAVLQEGRRILRDGGRLFAYDPSAHSPSMRLYRDPRSPCYSKEGKTDNEVLLDRNELGEDLRLAGFNDIRVAGIAGITFRYVEGRFARAMLPVYNLYEQILRFSPLERRFGTFLVSFGVRADDSHPEPPGEGVR